MHNVIAEALAIVLLLAPGAVRASAAQLSTFPVADGVNSWAYGINDNGYVVGAAGRGSLLPPGTYYGGYGLQGGHWAGNIVTGVLYSKGHVTWLGSSYGYESHDQSGDYAFTTFTFATAINNAGLIVGSVISDDYEPIRSSTIQSGYLFNGNLDGIPAYPLGGPATAINNKGQIVGGYGGPYEPVTGYLLDGGLNGRLTDLAPYGPTLPNSVNDAGQIVGTAQLNPDYPPSYPSGFAFLYQNGTFTDLGSLGVTALATHSTLTIRERSSGTPISAAGLNTRFCIRTAL